MPQFKHLSLLIYIIPYYDIFYINILFQVTQLIIRDGMEINIPFKLGWFSLKKENTFPKDTRFESYKENNSMISDWSLPE